MIRSGAAATIVALTLACADGLAPWGPTVRITEASVDARGGSILRSLDVSLDAPSAIRIDYWTDGGARLRVGLESAATEHRAFLPRLRAEQEYAFEVTPIGPDGDRGLPVGGTFQTGSLPPTLADLQMRVIGTATFPLLLVEISQPFTPGAPFIVDTDGYIVWHRDTAETRIAAGVTRLANGDFVFRASDALKVSRPNHEMVATLSPEDAMMRAGVDTFTTHHDVIATSDDRLLFLVLDTATVRDTVWTGEAIWEWDPVTDDLARRWRSFDFLSPERDRGPRTVPQDWLHANALAIGPRGNILVSLFWLHEVLSIAPDFESVEWRLGGPNSTFDVVDGAMDAGQHTPAEVSPDRIVLFDNGLDRPDGTLYSRALEIALDRDAGSAEVAWEFRPHPDIYSPIVSSTRRLANGNTVVSFGTGMGFFDPRATGPIGVYEVTPTNRVLWYLEMDGVRLMYRMTPLRHVGGEWEVTGIP